MMRESGMDAAGCALVAEVVRRAGAASLQVTGFSMLPAIWPGDVLAVESLSPAPLAPGQVVLYRREGRLTAHRIVQVEGDCVRTRGDSLPSLDPPVALSQIVGRVVGIRRKGREIEVRARVGQRAAAWLLRRSQACTRMLMRWSALQRRWRGSPAGAAIE